MPGLRRDSKGENGHVPAECRPWDGVDDTPTVRDTGKSCAWVTEGLIDAIKVMEANQRRLRPQAELAESAFSKLHFDFPVVQPEELIALAAELRSSLSSKAGGHAFPLTSKFVDNIIEGASYIPPAPPTTSSMSMLSSVPTSSSTSRNAPPPVSTATHTQSLFTSTSCQSEVPVGRPSFDFTPPLKSLAVAASMQLSPPMQASATRTAYQQLCSVVLLDWVSKLLSLPEEVAWNMLSSFHADEPLLPPADSTTSREQSEAAQLLQEPANLQAPQQLAALASCEKSVKCVSLPTSPSSFRSPQQGSGLSTPNWDNPAAELQDNVTSTSEGRAGPAAMAGIQMPNTDSSSMEGTRVMDKQLNEYEEVKAAELDGDDVVYEDIAVETGMTPSYTYPTDLLNGGSYVYPGIKSHQHLTSLTLHQSNTNATPSSAKTYISHPPDLNWSVTSGVPVAPYSWPALKHKLLALASHTRYNVMCDRNLWSHGSHLTDGVMSMLRTLGAHSRAGELQDLVAVYVRLLMERLVDTPSDMPLLGQLGEALGVAESNAAMAAPVSSRSSRAPSVLAQDTTVLMPMLTQLASRVHDPAHRSLLWQLINTHFLSCLDTGLAWVERAGESHPEALNSLSLICTVLEFHVVQAPLGQRVAGLGLIGRGTLRLLCVLFARHGAQPGAEALRRVLLLMAASSPSNQQWVVAVPGVQKALQDAHFSPGGAGEAHGIVWSLLQNWGHAVGAAVAVLDTVDKADEVLRALRLLQLLSACQAASPTSHPLWPPALHTHLQSTFDRLQKDLTTTPNPTDILGETTSKNSASTALPEADKPFTGLPGIPEACISAADGGSAASLLGDGVGDEGAVAGAGLSGDDKSPRGAETGRRAQQPRMRLACWRLLKEVLLWVGEAKKD